LSEQCESILIGCWSLIKQQRHEVCVYHVLSHVHMLSWALVEKHPVRLVERFETNPVVLVELLVFHHQ
jgi:uncharacterized protein (UPF0548 family)